MSRAKEVQEKLNLQAQLQERFSGTATKVLDWLGDTGNSPSNEYSSACDTFAKLPVIQLGAGLNLNSGQSATSSLEDIHTVGEFINGDKKVNSLAKKRQRPLDRSGIHTNSIYRASDNDTRAMTALKRKMRQARRQDNENNRFSKPKQAHVKHTKQEEDDDDDDEESSDEERIERASKKTYGLLFGSKKSNKKKK